MKLLAILISLSIERLINPGLFLQRFSWLSAYIAFLQRQLQKPIFWQGVIGIIVILTPLAATLATIYYGLGSFFYGMLKALIAIITLIYCLGPGDFRRQLEGYISSTLADDVSGSLEYAKGLIAVAMPESDNLRNRLLSEHALAGFNQEIFSVLFWFVLAGPLGALMYRVTALLHQQAKKPVTTISQLLPAIAIMQGLLEWLPIRLLGLSFALVGNFSHTFNYVLRQLLSGYQQNSAVLLRSGLHAVSAELPENSQANIDEIKSLLSLFDRTLVIWLVAIALFTLAYLLY